jgi:hypothetical protein
VESVENKFAVLRETHAFVFVGLFGAGDRDRTGDIQLGKLAFYR